MSPGPASTGTNVGSAPKAGPRNAWTSCSTSDVNSAVSISTPATPKKSAPTDASLSANAVAVSDPTSPMLALYIEALNETIDIENERAYAGVSVRVPDSVLLLLFIGSVMTLGMVGLSAGLTGRRSLLTAIAMIIVLGAVITLIIDIDRPQGGSVTVNQQPIIVLAEQLNPTAD